MAQPDYTNKSPMSFFKHIDGETLRLLNNGNNSSLPQQDIRIADNIRDSNIYSENEIVKQLPYIQAVPQSNRIMEDRSKGILPGGTEPWKNKPYGTPGSWHRSTPSTEDTVDPNYNSNQTTPNPTVLDNIKANTQHKNRKMDMQELINRTNRRKMLEDYNSRNIEKRFHSGMAQ